MFVKDFGGLNNGYNGVFQYKTFVIRVYVWITPGNGKDDFKCYHGYLCQRYNEWNCKQYLVYS